MARKKKVVALLNKAVFEKRILPVGKGTESIKIPPSFSPKKPKKK